MRKHTNFGHHDKRATGGGQDIKCSEGKTQSAAKRQIANDGAAKIMAKSSPIHVGGARAST